MSYSRTVKPGASPLGALREVHRWGRRTGVHKISLASQTYEKPTTRRNRIAEERAYYAKWFYLKYAAETVKHALKNHLLLAAPVDAADEQRLTALKPKGFSTAEEAKERMQAVLRLLHIAEAALMGMDRYSPITGAPREASPSSPSRPVSRLLRQVASRGGQLPSLSALQQQLQGQGWSGEEAAALRLQLAAWVELKLERQRLEDLVNAADGRTAKWATGMQQAELERLSLQGREAAIRRWKSEKTESGKS
ncbi:hypothetical protein Efla_002194 [Eimeria flavescens]